MLRTEDGHPHGFRLNYFLPEQEVANTRRKRQSQNAFSHQRRTRFEIYLERMKYLQIFCSVSHWLCVYTLATLADGMRAIDYKLLTGLPPPSMRFRHDRRGCPRKCHYPSQEQAWSFGRMDSRSVQACRLSPSEIQPDKVGSCQAGEPERSLISNCLYHPADRPQSSCQTLIQPSAPRTILVIKLSPYSGPMKSVAAWLLQPTASCVMGQSGP
jgi:hypothetical protein